MSFPASRLNLTLVIVSLYMVLDAAFMLVRVPPGTVTSVPTGELLIVFFFLSLPRDLDFINPFFRSVPFVPLVIWWLVGVTQLCIGFATASFSTRPKRRASMRSSRLIGISGTSRT